MFESLDKANPITAALHKDWIRSRTALNNRIATFCAGTEVPILVLEGLAILYGLEFSHRVSVEWDVVKNQTIGEMFAPDQLCFDICDMHKTKVYCAMADDSVVPAKDVTCAYGGFPCKDNSNLSKDCDLQSVENTSHQTGTVFKAIDAYMAPVSYTSRKESRGDKPEKPVSSGKDAPEKQFMILENVASLSNRKRLKKGSALWKSFEKKKVAAKRKALAAKAKSQKKAKQDAKKSKAQAKRASAKAKAQARKEAQAKAKAKAKARGKKGAAKTKKDAAAKDADNGTSESKSSGSKAGKQMLATITDMIAASGSTSDPYIQMFLQSATQAMGMGSALTATGAGSVAPPATIATQASDKTATGTGSVAPPATVATRATGKQPPPAKIAKTSPPATNPIADTQLDVESPPQRKTPPALWGWKEKGALETLLEPPTPTRKAMMDSMLKRLAAASSSDAAGPRCSLHDKLAAATDEELADIRPGELDEIDDEMPLLQRDADEEQGEGEGQEDDGENDDETDNEVPDCFKLIGTSDGTVDGKYDPPVKSSLETCHKMLKKSGWWVRSWCLDSGDFGLIQHRRRWYIVCINAAIISRAGVTESEMESLSDQYMEIAQRAHATQTVDELMLPPDHELVQAHFEYLANKVF